MRSVMTRVLPVPAPAMTSSGPLPWVMARRWASLSFRAMVSSGEMSKSVGFTCSG